MIVFHFTNKAAMDEGRAQELLCALKLLIFQVSELRTAENNMSFTQDEPVPTCVWRERSLTSGLMVNSQTFSTLLSGVIYSRRAENTLPLRSKMQGESVTHTHTHILG